MYTGTLLNLIGAVYTVLFITVQVQGKEVNVKQIEVYVPRYCWHLHCIPKYCRHIIIIKHLLLQDFKVQQAYCFAHTVQYRLYFLINGLI